MYNLLADLDAKYFLWKIALLLEEQVHSKIWHKYLAHISDAKERSMRRKMQVGWNSGIIFVRKNVVLKIFDRRKHS